MISLESMEELFDLLRKTESECDRMNSSLESVLGEDSRCMYLNPLVLVENAICGILVSEGETEDGASWMVHEGIRQIDRGGTEIGVDGKKYKIKSVADYHEFLQEMRKKNG